MLSIPASAGKRNCHRLSTLTLPGSYDVDQPRYPTSITLTLSPSRCDLKTEGYPTLGASRRCLLAIPRPDAMKRQARPGPADGP